MGRKWYIVTAIAAAGLALVLFLSSAQPTTPQVSGDMNGDVNRILTILGRKTYLYVPESTNSKAPRSAIFILHGSKEHALSMPSQTNFRSAADALNLVLVYPEMAVPFGMNWALDESDQAYFFAVLEALLAWENVDRSKVFAVGHSAGATASLFMGNNWNLFAKVAAVEGAVGQLERWDLQQEGVPSLLVWNRGDPVLEEYSPVGGELGYLTLTVSTLRRHAKHPWVPLNDEDPLIRRTPLLTDAATPEAERIEYLPDPNGAADAPPLTLVRFRTIPGVHQWAANPWSTVSATEEVLRFFVGAN